MTDNQMQLPTWMIYQSFRYVLGRRSYAVSTWCDWCVEYWSRMPESDRLLIARELEEAFESDDEARERGREPFRLGMNCDRASWERVRKLYKGKENG